MGWRVACWRPTAHAIFSHADVGASCRVVAMYGLRGTRVGEASHPGPAGHTVKAAHWMTHPTTYVSEILSLILLVLTTMARGGRYDEFIQTVTHPQRPRPPPMVPAAVLAQLMLPGLRKPNHLFRRRR